MNSSRTVARLALGALLAIVPAAASAQEDERSAAEVLRDFERRLQALEDENRALREQVRTLAEPRPGAGVGSDEDVPGPPLIPGSGPTPANELGRGLGPDVEGAFGTPSDPVSEDPTRGSPVRSIGPTGPTSTSRGSRSRLPLKAWLGQGFELASDDDEFQIQFHNETQVDYRLFDHTGQGTVHSGFFIPRQIWGINGRFTRSVEYMATFQRGLGSFELRDALVNFRVRGGDRLMLKLGRYRVPYTYEFYAISNQDLISPERSVYAINYGNNREIGASAWGVLFDDRVDYAVGAFNGPRNSYEDLNDEPNFIGFVNARPFRHSTRFEALNYLNLGGSVDVGNMDSNLAPAPLRTSVNSSLGSGASTASPAFLSFNNSVREEGPRALYSLHAAWFYKRLSVLAEWDRGLVGYRSAPDAFGRVQVPVDGYYVQAGFFLTGEHVTRRGPIDIKKPFNLKRDEFGLGAFELAARYASLRLGDEVFTTGLSDPNQWSDSVGVYDIGINWYLNKYLKVYFDWQHSEFGDPVYFGQGRFYKTSELFWARLQFLF